MADVFKINVLGKPFDLTYDPGVVPPVSGGDVSSSFFSGYDHSVARFDGTTGKLIEQSLTFLSYDDGTISNPAAVGETTTERFGLRALNSVTTGVNLTAFGTDAGTANEDGRDNAFFGTAAGSYNISGISLAFFGAGAGLVNTASNNSFFGAGAGNQNTTGTRNTGGGAGALLANQDKDDNTAWGYSAGLYIEGNRNTSIGSQAGSANNILAADDSTAVGYRALYVDSGGQNTAVGSKSLIATIGAGVNNAALGYLSGATNTTGARNTYIGATADANATTYDQSTALGYGALITASNQIVLGTTAETVVLSGYYTFPLPSADGSSGNMLITNASGVLSWTTAGNMNTATYDPASIAEQLVGLTATQALTNKTGAISMWTNDSGYITASSADALSNKTGNISMWTNDASYITAAAVTIATAEANDSITPIADGNYTISNTLGGSVTTVKGIITAWTPAA